MRVFFTRAVWVTFSVLAPLAVSAQGQVLANPLGTSDLRVAVGVIIKSVLGISGIVALLMFVYGGIIWMVSGGNPALVKKGKDTLIWSSLGLAVMFSAYIITNLIIRTISAGVGA